MKKMTLFIGLFIMTTVITSCDNGKSNTEDIMKATEEFFAQSELKLNQIDNADDFINFYNSFNNDKNEFIQDLFTQYPADENGDFKGMTSEETEAVNNKIKECSNAFNEKATIKCAKFLTPRIEKLEAVIGSIEKEIETTGEQSDDSKTQLTIATNEIEPFSDFDIIPLELQDRFDKITTILDSIAPEPGSDNHFEE